MKNLLVIGTVIIAGLTLNSCATDQPLTKPQRCVEIDRQIAAYQHPSSGYSWNVAQMKAKQLRDHALAIGCE